MAAPPQSPLPRAEGDRPHPPAARFRPGKAVGAAAFAVAGIVLITGFAMGLLRAMAVRTVADEPAGTIILQAGRLLDGTGAEPRYHVALVIRDGLIADVVPLPDAVPGPGVRVINARNATVLPGFINANAHVHRWVGPGGAVWVQGGVTTIADLATPLARIQAYRREFDGPDRPHFLAAGPIVTAAGGYPSPVHGPTSGLAVDGPDDAVRKIRALVDDYQVDLIKIAISSFDPEWPRLSLEEVRAVVDAAHAAGRRVLAHVDREDDFRRALEGGVDALAHVPWEPIPDELLALAAERGMIVIPTLELLWKNYHFLRRLGSQAHFDNARRFHAMGGRLALGDDVGNPNIRPGLPFTEIEFLQFEVGLSPMEVIVAGTKHSATALGIDHLTGTLEPGKQADLIVVEGNPLEDLAALKNIRLVMKAGVVAYQRGD